MHLNVYQGEASGTAIYPGRNSPHGLMYAALKLNGEAGELAGHIVDAIDTRGNVDEDKLIVNIVKELGDCAWYCAAIADELKVPLETVIRPETDLGKPADTEEAIYLTLKLNSAAGSIAEIVGKAMRDEGYGMPPEYNPGALREGDAGNGQKPTAILSPERKAKVIGHLEMILITISQTAIGMNTSLDHVLETNLKKLADRKARGVLGGSGDNR